MKNLFQYRLPELLRVGFQPSPDANRSTDSMDNESLADRIDVLAETEQNLKNLNEEVLNEFESRIGKDLKVDIKDSSSRLRMRDDNGKVIGKLKDGEKVTFLRDSKLTKDSSGQDGQTPDDHLWLKVEYTDSKGQGKQGWVSAEYLKGFISNPKPEEPAEPVPTPKPEPEQDPEPEEMPEEETPTVPEPETEEEPTPKPEQDPEPEEEPEEEVPIVPEPEEEEGNPGPDERGGDEGNSGPDGQEDNGNGGPDESNAEEGTDGPDEGGADGNNGPEGDGTDSNDGPMPPDVPGITSPDLPEEDGNNGPEEDPLEENPANSPEQNDKLLELSIKDKLPDRLEPRWQRFSPDIVDSSKDSIFSGTKTELLTFESFLKMSDSFWKGYQLTEDDVNLFSTKMKNDVFDTHQMNFHKEGDKFEVYGTGWFSDEQFSSVEGFLDWLKTK